MLDGGADAAQRPEVARGREEVEQGMAMVTGEASPHAAQPGVGYAGGSQTYGSGSEQAYNSGVAGAGTTMPITAALGAGTGGAYPSAEYERTAGFGQTNPAAAGGRNDAEFQARDGGYPVQGGAGPVPDHTSTGPGTGVASAGIQRLP